MGAVCGTALPAQVVLYTVTGSPAPRASGRAGHQAMGPRTALGLTVAQDKREADWSPRMTVRLSDRGYWKPVGVRGV